MAAASAAGPVRRLDVAIYDDDGTSLLRESTGGRYGVRELQFESGLPGGFLSASFQLPNPTARNWPGRPGLRTIVRRGNRVLWWGWIEDIRRMVRGGVEGLQVTCMGPWQQLLERYCSPNYAGTLYGDAALATELYASCPEISPNYTGLAQTLVNVAPLTWTNQPVADLVKLVCKGGNSSGQQMLFGVWEPTGRSTSGYPTAINTNPNFETEAGVGDYAEGWYLVTSLGDATYDPWHTAIYNSPSHAWKVYRGSAAGTQTGYVATHPSYRFAVTAGSSYVVDYWVYFGAVASMSCYGRVTWYNAGGGYIRQTALTTRNSTGSAFSARYVQTATAPALAASCALELVFALPDSGANSFLVFDDAYMYAPGTVIALDTKPQAVLWARDLSAADYLLYTAELGTALGVDETTRTLANYVVGKYGTSYTAGAQDATSQGLYRRRDGTADAGSGAGSTVATAARDAYLAAHKDPMLEPGAFKLTRPGAVRTTRGAVVWPELLRAGDRLQVADGPLAGEIVLLTRVAYANGVVNCTPERPGDVPVLLAKNVTR